MSPENLNDPADNLQQRLIRDLAEQLDQETLVMSGGYDELNDFQELIEFGEPALLVLLEGVEESGWWRVQAVCQIADELGKPIEFPKEAPGMYGVVRDEIAKWGKQHGYIADESAPK